MGIIASVSLHFLMFSRIHAIAVLNNGAKLQDPLNPGSVNSLDVLSTASLIEKASSQAFAQQIVSRIARPDLEKALTPKRFGGLGWLSIRSIKDTGFIEIKAESTDALTSLQIVDAAVATIIEEQIETRRPFEALQQKRLADLRSLERLEADNLAMWTKVLQPENPSFSLADRAFVLARRENAFINVENVRRQIASFAVAELRNEIEAPRIVTRTTVLRPSTMMPWFFAVCGAFAGLIAAFLALQFIDLARFGVRHHDDSRNGN